MKKLFPSIRLAILAALSMSTLAGCELYFGEPDDPPGRPGGGVEPGFACSDNADCAAGCYCDMGDGQSAQTGGVCAEAGFCSSDEDCGEGFVCDDRNSCVPSSCSTNADCGTGSVCNNGRCEETCVCESDTQAADLGDFHCDEGTSTCIPGPDPSGSCGGAVTCNQNPPNCPEGFVPLINSAGCYNAPDSGLELCRPIAQCDVTPVCEALQHQGDCEGRVGECTSVSVGKNCTTPSGAACQSGDTNCTCETFEFRECETTAN